MGTGMKISIIVPAYNSARYLPECLDSILNQTYGNIEVMVVDDGSTDETPSICDKYSLQDPRVKVIHKTNGGVQSARCMGTKEASGDWCFFVDSDDTIMPDTIESALSLTSDDKDLVAMEDYQNLELTPAEYGVRLLNFNRVQIWGKLYRKSILDDGRVFEMPRDIAVAEDLITNTRCLKHLANNVVISSLKKYNYRVVSNSVSHSFVITPEYDLKVMGYMLKAIEETPLNIKQGAVAYQTGILKHLICWKYPYDRIWAERLCEESKECDLDWMRRFVLMSTKKTFFQSLVKPMDYVYRFTKKLKQTIKSN